MSCDRLSAPAIAGHDSAFGTVGPGTVSKHAFTSDPPSWNHAFKLLQQ